MKIKYTLNKEIINDKLRPNLLIEIFSKKKKTLYFLQADTNIWWKPKRINTDNQEGLYTSYGWLFMQVGNYKLKNKHKF